MEIESFKPSKGTVRAIELLNEPMYLKIFDPDKIPKPDICLVYRILFQLIVSDVKNDTMDDREFWKICSNHIQRESNKQLGTYLLSLIDKFDFSDENIQHTILILGDRSSRMIPSYFTKLCGTTGLMIFFLREALVHSGIIEDMKTPPSRSYKNYLYTISKIENQINRIKGILNRIV